MTAPLGFVAATALGVALGAATTVAVGAEPADAEYSIRWNARDGGPATLNATLLFLHTHATRARKFSVDYYDVPATTAAPPGFSVILRRRTEDSAPAEFTWKLRGDRALADWTCPWRNSKEAKSEVDVAFRSGGDITRSFSYSCTGEGPDLAASGVSATIRPCTSEVVRQDAGKLKIEEWHLPGNVTVIDVSLSGKNAPGALELFRKRIAEPLLAAGVVASADSKSELGGRCP